MRTYTLSKDISPDDACDFLRNQLCISQEDDSESMTRPAFQSISGLFMFKEPLCVRTDITDHMGWSPSKKGEAVDYLPEILASAIKEWYKEGTGTSIIHMRNYATTYARGRYPPKSESFPYKTPEGTYFYHLGRYGTSSMWGQVAYARQQRYSVPKMVYNHFMAVKNIAESTDGLRDDWQEQLNVAHHYEDTPRAFTVAEWKDGEIIDSHTNLDTTEMSDEYSWHPHIVPVDSYGGDGNG